MTIRRRKPTVKHPPKRRKVRRRRSRRRPAPARRPPAPTTRTTTPPVPARTPTPVYVAPPAAQPRPAPAVPPQPPVAPRPRPLPPPEEQGWGRHQAERLLWRAGFGPRPGDVDRIVALGPQEAVRSLTHVSGPATLVGPEPRDDDGQPLAPRDAWGHDHLAWLDRMVRSDQPLVERMALIWHDWFATSNDKVGNQGLMLDQIELFRSKGLGSFRDLLLDVTVGPAMLIWLDSIDNNRWRPNENYARELMELFTLGADRGAYTETDVRELTHALSGFRADWSDAQGLHNFRFDPNYFWSGTKTVFGRTGSFGWRDAVQLCLENPFHASFFVTKLWSYFAPTPCDPGTQAALQAIYLGNDYGIAPVVEAILAHPDVLAGAAMVKPPVVYTAGLLRNVGRGIDTEAWAWLCDLSGQRLLYPPNVSGWDDSTWLNTSTWRGRFHTVTYAVKGRTVAPWTAGSYSSTEDAGEALENALTALGRPAITTETWRGLLSFAERSVSDTLSSWQRAPYRAMRQNALRQLILTSSDYLTS